MNKTITIEDILLFKKYEEYSEEELAVLPPLPGLEDFEIYIQ